MTLRDVLPFIRAWSENPQSVGAIAPSSTALAELTRARRAATGDPCSSSGAGTGVFTEGAAGPRAVCGKRT